MQGDNGDLSVQPRIRLARMIDEVRCLVGRERGEIESLLDLHGVTPDVLGELVQLLGDHDPTAPHADQLAGLDYLPGEYGFAAGHVTILDFTFIGEVRRRFRAHEASACRAERCAPQYIDGRCAAAPGSTSAREESPSREKHMRSSRAHLQKNAS